MTVGSASRRYATRPRLLLAAGAIALVPIQPAGAADVCVAWDLGQWGTGPLRSHDSCVLGVGGTGPCAVLWGADRGTVNAVACVFP